jgi:hypothetical protein
MRGVRLVRLSRSRGNAPPAGVNRRSEHRGSLRLVNPFDARAEPRLIRRVEFNNQDRQTIRAGRCHESTVDIRFNLPVTANQAADHADRPVVHRDDPIRMISRLVLSVD